MKQTLLIISAIVAASLCFGGWTYFAHDRAPHGTELSTLVDKTDSLASSANADEVLNLYEIDADIWQRLRFRIQAITDIGYNTSHTEGIEQQNQLFSNPYARRKDLDSFQSRVTADIDSMNHTHIGLQRSSIWLPFIREVNRLSTSPCAQKIAVLYSNCEENSRIYSTYTPYGYRLLVDHPEKVKELLLGYATPDNLKNVTVYIVCKPRTDRDDDCFNRMSKIFKEILESAGARVCISANLVS